MSDQGPSGKKGKGRGKKRGGRGRGRQQRQGESVPGGLQQRRDESQVAAALPEQTKAQQCRQHAQKQQRKQQPKDEQQGATAMQQGQQQQQQRWQQQQQGRQQQQQGRQQQQQGRQQLQQGRQLQQGWQQQQGRQQQQQGCQQPQKQQQRKQQPRDQTNGAGPSKPQGQPSQGPTPQDSPQPKAQPSTQLQPSVEAAKAGPPQHPQPPCRAEKPDQPSQQRGTPARSDRAVPKPPRRPDGGGRSGRPIQLRANFLPVKLPTDGEYHLYDTDIREKGRKSGEGYIKSERPKIIQAVVKLYEKENPSGPKLVFDRAGQNVYSRRLIPGIDKGCKRYNLQFTTDNGKEKEFVVDIKYAAAVSLYDLNEALEGRNTEIPYHTMQAIEVVLQQLPKTRTVQVRSSFFDYPSGRGKDLGGGVQMWNGSFVSIRPTQWKMMLNVNTCGAGFYKPQPVVEFLCEFQSSQNTPTRLDEKQRKKFAKEMNGIKIEPTHVKRKPRKCAGLSLKSAREEVFEHEGEEVSVANYFREKYKKQLEYPDLPCVKIGQKGSLIPMELCRVSEGQKKQTKLTRQQTQEMIRHTAIPAPDYMQKIMQLIQKLRYESDPYSRDFGISIGKEMVTIQGRVLEPPILIYGPRNRPGKETPQDGSWKNTKPMLDAKELREWALISYRHNDDRRRVDRKYRGPNFLDDRGMADFIYYLVDVGRKKGVRVNENPCYVEIERGFQDTDKLFNNLKTRYPNLQLIVVILPVNGDDFYEEVKHCGDIVYGVTTQCIKVEHASSDFTVWRNQEILARLWLQINAKLGGTTCALDKAVKSPILQKPVIIFGMIFDIHTVPYHRTHSCPAEFYCQLFVSPFL